jgi:hypothetical protein
LLARLGSSRPRIDEGASLHLGCVHKSGLYLISCSFDYLGCQIQARRCSSPGADGEGGDGLFSQARLVRAAVASSPKARTARAAVASCFYQARTTTMAVTSSPRRGQRLWWRPLLPGEGDNKSVAKAALRRRLRGTRCPDAQHERNSQSQLKIGVFMELRWRSKNEDHLLKLDGGLFRGFAGDALTADQMYLASRMCSFALSLAKLSFLSGARC